MNLPDSAAFGPERFRPQQFQGRRNGLPKLLIIQADAFPRFLHQITKALYLTPEVVLALAVYSSSSSTVLPMVSLKVGGHGFPSPACQSDHGGCRT